MAHRTRILVPHVVISSFIRSDIEILRQEHDVTLVDCSTIPRMFRALLAVPRVDIIFCWFGSLRFLPLVILGRLWGKRIVIVAGGYDVANVPTIGYGNMAHPISRSLGRRLFRLAHTVIAVSQFSCREAINNAGVSPQKIATIPLGFDPESEHRLADVPKQDLVVTLGVGNVSSIRRKGILTVAELSRRLPDVSFVIAGRCDDEALALLRTAAGKNVTFSGELSDSERRALFARAKVYMQPSLHEAFGCSVAEAMLQDCIPIVSPAGALPEVVGTAGLYVSAHDCDGLGVAVRKVLAGEHPSAVSPRERIVSEFGRDKRRTALLSLLNSADWKTTVNSS